MAEHVDLKRPVIEIHTPGESFLVNMENLKLKDSPPEDYAKFKFQPAETTEATIESGKSSVDSKLKNSKPNRRYNLRPKKLLNYQDLEQTCEVIKTPPKNKLHSVNKNLETIFEDPKVSGNGVLNVLGKTKLKRFITFNEFVSKAKIKHRKAKAKRLAKDRGKKSVKCKLTLEDVKLKLKSLESSDEEPQCMDIQD